MLMLSRFGICSERQHPQHVRATLRDERPVQRSRGGLPTAGERLYVLLDAYANHSALMSVIAGLHLLVDVRAHDRVFRFYFMRGFGC